MKRDFFTTLQNQQPQGPMDENVAQKLINNYLQLWTISDFQLGKIESKGDKFEVNAVSAGGVFIDRTFVVDKHTGWVQFISRMD